MLFVQKKQNTHLQRLFYRSFACHEYTTHTLLGQRMNRATERKKEKKKLWRNWMKRKNENKQQRWKRERGISFGFLVPLPMVNIEFINVFFCCFFTSIYVHTYGTDHERDCEYHVCKRIRKTEIKRHTYLVATYWKGKREQKQKEEKSKKKEKETEQE